MTKFFPEALFERGFTDLISVSPPGAQLTPSSKIAASQLGKVPARRLPNGLYAGYDWRRFPTTATDVHQWCIDGANVGLRADRFPAVDIDCTDPGIAQMIEDIARVDLGTTPIRWGRRPKRLMIYRTEEPFTRMRLWIKKGDDHHLVEFLGQGQQYLVHGTHPGTMKPYEWTSDLIDAQIPLITREQAVRFMDNLQEYLELCSVGAITREGDGRPESRVAASDQTSLQAPSIEILQEAVALIPNTNDLFETRQSYLTMGYAIRAAAGDDEETGFDIFASWADRWEGNDRAEANDPDVVRADWRRFKGPYAIGWSWIAEQARAFGFNDAAIDFDAIEEKPTEKPLAALEYSDQWLADEVVRRKRGVLRYVPQRDCWLVWNDGRWRVDAELLAEDAVKRTLREIANEVYHGEFEGASEKELAALKGRAMQILSADKASSITRLARSDRAIAVSAESLDHNEWVLNTPGGLIDLRTGQLGAADPDALCTKATAVPADFGGACPLWRRFLAEATGGDRELEGYMQRYAGYSLTGSTEEEQFAFLYGDGGNGKGVFIDTIRGVLGDYGTTSSMDTFTESYGDKHSTDLAMMAGARLVTADETKAGKRWDDQRVKSLTGGGLVTARFMRQDNFTFKPQFKLLFAGNHKPALDEVGKAMKRRLHLVPFTVEPKVVDKKLKEKLRAEWPAILAWMLEGCLEWQKTGLQAPASIVAFSEEYFAEEDLVGQWIQECCVQDAAVEFVPTVKLYQSYDEWCNGSGIKPFGLKRFVASLGKRLERTKEKSTRRAGFKGVRVNRMDLESIS